MSSKSFGAYVRSLRKAKGITIKELALMIGVSHPMMQMIETGNRNASSDLIRLISAALGCTHIGMMIKAGHVTEQEVFGWIHTNGKGVNHEP